MTREVISVGRVVHYTSLGSAPQDGVQQYPPKCRAAIVTEVLDVSTGEVHMTVLNPEGFQLAKSVLFDQDLLDLNGTATPGTWHLPERAVAPLAGNGAGPKEL